MADDLALAWRSATAELLMRTRSVQPDELAGTASSVLVPLGITATMYLVDPEQLGLHPLPAPGQPTGRSIGIDGTPAGRGFAAVEAVTDGDQVWYPLLDGSERLGMLALDGPVAVRSAATVSAEVDAFAALLGHLVAVLSVYGERFARIRRTRPMSVAAELLWRQLPPLTYVTDRFTLSAILEPCYSVGGDGFDYGVYGATLSLGIFDSTGHGLQAGIATAVTMSTIRTARISGADLPDLAATVDAALTKEFTDARFTTAVLAELDLDTGVLRYLNAGHPPPLVLRGAKVVDRLDGAKRMPLGVPDVTPPVEAVQLEPGDRLLAYTDGVVEARDPSGVEFGVDRLIELASTHAERGLSAPETLRRLCHDVLSRYGGPPADDATLLLVEWSRSAARRLLP